MYLTLFARNHQAANTFTYGESCISGQLSVSPPRRHAQGLQQSSHG